MKIITGKYKGRRLAGFNLEGTRPTMDRVKESIFGMIQSNLDNSVVLDLFAGSGNLGIEALSEGAKKAYLVDSNNQAIKIMKKNIQTINIEGAECIQQDYKKALFRFALEKIKFDFIFLDPPYQTNYIEESIIIIEENDLLTENGIIICESNQIEKINYSKNWKSVKEKKYGDKVVVLLQKI